MVVMSVVISNARKTGRKCLFKANWLRTSVRITENVWFQFHEDTSSSMFRRIPSRCSISVISENIRLNTDYEKNKDESAVD